MKTISLPHTIENKLGERLTFERIEKENGQEKVIVRGICKPGAGPAMHTHWKQDEFLKVEKGRLGYQLFGEEEKFLNPGESILFKRGTPHRFWNAGETDMEISGWISPPNTIVPYLSAVYAAQDRGKEGRPETFDGAWLLVKYKNEYDMPEIPGFVKAVIMPFTVFLGNILGKYRKFRNMPTPLR